MRERERGRQEGRRERGRKGDKGEKAKDRMLGISMKRNTANY